MQQSSQLSIKTLKILTQNSTKRYTLEELTSIVISPYELPNGTSQDRGNQSIVLDILILLESEGLIFLNSLTDESQVKTKRYLKIV